MSRRANSDRHTAAFGSDSFLDVVANTVGVLIILIVLVGMRVRNAPPSASPPSGEDRIVSPPSDFVEARLGYEAERSRILAENMIRAEARRAGEAARESKLRGAEARMRRRERLQAELDRRRDEHLAESARRREVQRSVDEEAGAMDQAVAALLGEWSHIQKELAERKEAENAARGAMEKEIADRERGVRELEREAAEARRRRTEAASTLEQSLANLAELRKRIEDASRTKGAAQTLVHRAASVARLVDLQEVHFRCAGGRAAYTYLDELLDETREQANRRITPSTMRLNGVAGPIGGFRLRYLLARPPMSMTEQLSQPVFRFSLVHWELAADSDRIGETLDEVLQPNSAFRVKLRSLSASSHAATLWVYPDSFALAKRIETFLHEQGYTVSLRPLPKGVPIIGSPYGSASYSQ